MEVGVARVDAPYRDILQRVEVSGVVRVGEMASGTFSSRMKMNVPAKRSPFSLHVCDRALGPQSQFFTACSRISSSR